MTRELDLGLLYINARCTLKDLDDSSVASGLEDLSRSLGAIWQCEGDDFVEARKLDLSVPELISTCSLEIVTPF